MYSGDVAKLRDLWIRFVTDYQPQGVIFDLLLGDFDDLLASKSMSPSTLYYSGVTI
jgi:hypothetical protein